MDENNESSPCVMAYIPEDDEESLKGYKEAADSMGDTFSYGYSSKAELFGRKLTSASAFVYKPRQNFSEKYDGKPRKRFTGSLTKPSALTEWLKKSSWTLVLQADYSSLRLFEEQDSPLVILFTKI